MPRTWRYGPEPIPMDRLPDHFWSKVDKNGPLPPDDPSLGQCWIWTDTRKDKGYGVFNVRRRAIYAHRYAYQITYGPIMDGLQVLHNCHNGQRGCVRPSHLRTGTALENSRDAVKRGSFYRETCKRGHVYAEVGYRMTGRDKRQCEACLIARRKRKARPPRPPVHLCAGVNYSLKHGEPCLRKIGLDKKYCWQHGERENVA